MNVLDKEIKTLFKEYLDEFENDKPAKDKFSKEKKQQFYNFYSEILEKKLNLLSENLKIKYLAEEINEKKDEILKSKNSIERKLREIAFDITNRKLEYAIEQQDNSDSSENLFQYYPEFTNKLFNKYIYTKKEFNKNKIPPINEYEELQKNSIGFKKTESQKFVKNYISHNTPYNGILLWHGVGVGKTCAAISIAENFKNYLKKKKKKIVILTPGFTLETNWRDEIFNLDKELYDKHIGIKQCTGNKYLNELNNFFKSKTKNEKKKKQITKIIEKYYEFYGYQKLVSDIEKVFGEYDKIYKTYSESCISINAEYNKIKYIKERFSDTVIILDEVHVTRTNDGGKEEKKVPPYLELIARYAENTKFILLSATPMYNISKEVIWLINLLLLNDKKSPIEEFEIFDKDNDIKIYSNDSIKKNDLLNENIDINKIIEGSTALRIIIDKSRGYISYLRGEHPFKFPSKIFPESRTYTPDPLYDYKNQKLINKIPNKKLILYKNEMSIWQFYHLFEQFAEIPEDESDLIREENKKKKAFGNNANMASNIVFPDLSNEHKFFTKGEPCGLIGDDGIKNIFEYDQISKQYTYKQNYINTNNEGIFHRNRIEKYSAKFKNIIDNIVGNKDRHIFPSQGIVFIFSQYIAHGIEPISIMLEENGFKRYIYNNFNKIYQEKNILKKKIEEKDLFCSKNKVYKQIHTTNEFKQARYIYLDGKSTEIEREKLVKIARDKKNINGEEVLVILGSKVLEHGISFFNVRETHILEPWHHLNMIEQAVGRTIRNFSHINFERKFQNTTLFLHCSALPNIDELKKFRDETRKREVASLSDMHIAKLFFKKTDDELNIETWDERIYRRAYQKKKHMSIIERVLKINSIDCQLNKYGNVYSQDTFDFQQSMINSKGHEIIVPLYDTDFSQKCDYLKCDYKCDWVNDDSDIEMAHQHINSDTYNISFDIDDIYLAKEIIKFLYLEYSTVAYDIDFIVNYVKTYNFINVDAIYIALDELVKNNEILYDSIYNEGYLIYRDNLYIFQPLALNSDTPKSYRKDLLNYLPKQSSIELNYDVITKDFSEHEKTSVESTEMDTLLPEKIYKEWVIKAFGSISPEDPLKIQNIILIDKELPKKIKLNESNNSFSYIENKYGKEWFVKTDGKFNPSIYDFTQMRIISLIERQNYQIKKILFEFSLINIIENKLDPSSKKINELDIIIFNHYTKQYSDKNIHSIYTQSEIPKELYDSTNDEFRQFNLPIYFRITISYTDINKNFIIHSIFKKYNIKKNKWEDITNNSKMDKFIISDNSLTGQELIYGFLSNKSSQEKVDLSFYVVNNIGDKVEDKEKQKQNKKVIKTGAICGTGSARYKKDIISIINHLYEFLKITKSMESDYIVDSYDSKKKKYLCEELELMLRYRESLLQKDDKIRFFYNVDESINFKPTKTKTKTKT